MNSKNKFPVRHFIMIPLEDSNFLESYKNFCETLKSYNPSNFDEELLQKPSKLHISVLIFDLKEDQQKIN